MVWLSQVVVAAGELVFVSLRVGSANVRFRRLWFIGAGYVGVGGGCSGLVGVQRLTIAEVFSLALVALSGCCFFRFLGVGRVIVSNFLFFPFSNSSWNLRTFSSVLVIMSR